jgi:hypothetical protein
MDKALLGAIIGGSIAFVGQNFVEFAKTRRDRLKAEALVRAYLVGIIDITEHLQHVEYDLIVTGDLPRQTNFLRKDDAADLARFIAAMQAIRINMARVNNPAFKMQSIDRRIAHVDWTLQQWFRAKEIAQGLINRL